MVDITSSIKNFVDRLRGKKQELLSDMKRLGLNMMLNETLAGRIEAYAIAMAEIDQETDPIEKLKKMDDFIQMGAAPWARSGDDQMGAKLMIWWQVLYRNAKNMSNVLEEENPDRKARAITLYKRFVDEIISYGKIVAALTYKDKDISEYFIALLHSPEQPFMMGGGAVTPFRQTAVE
ncbi:MAG: hypothetical protein QXP04_00320 [Candidatus Nanoarchaeia archaeon]|nr:hypothetical protein [Candidatus Jingweiarchaeum tengchongense]